MNVSQNRSYREMCYQKVFYFTLFSVKQRKGQVHMFFGIIAEKCFPVFKKRFLLQVTIQSDRLKKNVLEFK